MRNKPLPSRKPTHQRSISAITGVSIIAVAAATVQAQPAAGWKQLSIKQLAAECHAADPALRANCVGYVSGIYDLQFAPAPPRGVCPPTELTPDLLAEVVTAYVDTHDDGPASAAVGQAVVRFFPCPEQHR
jgi:hypothetical protein